MNRVIHSIDPEELMAYLDGELPADRAATTAAHLGECAECQSLVAELRGVSQDLKTWRVEPADSPMPTVIATALAERKPPSRTIVSAQQPSWRAFLSQRWGAVALAGAMAYSVNGVVGVPTCCTPQFDRHRQVGQAIEVDGRPVPAPPSAAPVIGRQFDRLEQFGKSHDALIPPPPPPPPLAAGFAAGTISGAT